MNGHLFYCDQHCAIAHGSVVDLILLSSTCEFIASAEDPGNMNDHFSVVVNRLRKRLQHHIASMEQLAFARTYIVRRLY
jgi:hypothetical protein